MIEAGSQGIEVNLERMYYPNEKQKIFHGSNDKYKLYGGALGGGKTACIINEGIQLNIDYPHNYGLLLRKTFPSFRDTVLPQLEKFLDPRMVIDWNHSYKLITMWNHSKIRYGGFGDDPEDWKKFMSGEYGWIAIDQGEEFSEEDFKMLATRLRLNLPDILRFFLMTCNPTIGWIKERFIESDLYDHIFVPALPIDNIENLPEGYIEDMKEILDENMQKALLEGDWSAVGDPDQVYSHLQVLEAVKRKSKHPFEGMAEIGVDVARSGNDETVIATKENLDVKLFSKKKGHDTMRTVAEIWICVEDLKKRHGKDLKIVYIKIDADGLGAGVFDRVRELKEDKEKEYSIVIRLMEIHGAGKADHPAQFKNKRAEIHWALRELLDDISLPNDGKLISQMMSIKYDVLSSGQKMIIPKKEIKKKLGKNASPDRAEAVIYTCGVSVSEEIGFAFSKHDVL